MDNGNTSDEPIEVTLDAFLSTSVSEHLDATASHDQTHESGSSSLNHSSMSESPQVIGRYRVTNLLGEGGYGRVYKAFDEQLRRHVAVKVPHLYHLASSKALEKYLEEARTLARLDRLGFV